MKMTSKVQYILFHARPYPVLTYFRVGFCRYLKVAGPFVTGIEGKALTGHGENQGSFLRSPWRAVENSEEFLLCVCVWVFECDVCDCVYVFGTSLKMFYTITLIIASASFFSIHSALLSPYFQYYLCDIIKSCCI